MLAYRGMDLYLCNSAHRKTREVTFLAPLQLHPSDLLPPLPLKVPQTTCKKLPGIKDMGTLVSIASRKPHRYGVGIQRDDLFATRVVSL